MNDPLSYYSYLFELENDLTKTYKMELELIIMFQLLIIGYSENFIEQKKKYLFSFIIERRPILLCLDININIPTNQSVKL